MDDTEIYDNQERVRRIQRMAEHVDVISCNYMEQWYPLIQQAISDKPIMGSEKCTYGDLEVFLFIRAPFC